MDSLTVLGKTALGVEALNQRSADLPRVLRHALILVDGRANLAELEARGAIVPNFSEALVDLLARGLIAERREARPPKAAVSAGDSFPAVRALAPAPEKAAEEVLPAPTSQDSLVALAEGLLGKRGDKVVKKIRDAGPSRDELLAASDACFKLIRLTIDEKLADKFRDAARLLLGPGG